MKDRERTRRPGRSDPSVGVDSGRGVKTETVVLLMVAAFFAGLVVGSVAALLKTSRLEQEGVAVFPGRTEAPQPPTVDVLGKIQRLRDLVEKDPGNRDGWERLGDTYSRNGRYVEAAEAYTEAIRVGGGKADLLVKLGNAHFDGGAYQKAVGAYLEALNMDPDNADVLTDLGVAYRRTKRPDKAVEAFRRAIRSDPHHLNSRYNLGVVLLHDLRDIQGAVDAWEEFIRIAPMDERAGQLRRMVETLRTMSPGREVGPTGRGS
ncbi:MAG: tetratricopeptide repeat protein [Deltaproteobacteria bacterium]|nr:tetratricopeptide repeat protein [Deltaproteobacteria bacterium]